MQNCKIFLLVGPSGVGKSAIIKDVINKIPGIKIIPSFTTRSKRKNEKERREHFFVSNKRFKQLIREGKLLEFEEVHPGLFYGMPLEETKKELKEIHLIRDIDVLGEKSVRNAFPKNTVSIFVSPPSLSALERRIRKRGNIGEREIKNRLKRASFEMKRMNAADYHVVNDKLKKCVKEVSQIIRKEIKQGRH